MTTLATTMNIDTLVTAAKIKLGSFETGITWKNKHPEEHGVYKPTLCVVHAREEDRNKNNRKSLIHQDYTDEQG